MLKKLLNRKKVGCLGLFGSLLLASAIYTGTVVMAEETEPKSVAIEIDMLGYDTYNLPNGVEGKTYPVFKATATDDLGNEVENIETMVFYDVGGDTGKGITSDDRVLAIKNGRFHTDEAGTYVIEYVATSGAVQTIKKLFVTVQEESAYVAPKYTIHKDIKREALTGTKVYLPEGELTIDETYGETEVKVEVVYTGKYTCDKVEILQGQGGVDFFIPKVAGTYELTYEMINILGEEAATAQTRVITVSDSAKPIMEEPIVGRVLHVGEKTDFPVVEAVLYHEGKAVYVPVSVTVGNVDISDEMSYTAGSAGQTTVKYTAQSILNAGAKVVYEYPIVIYDLDKDTEGILVEKYMYLEGLTGAYRGESTTGQEGDVYTLTANGSSKTAAMYFKTKIEQSNLQIKFGVENTMNNFGSVSAIFTDSKNRDERVEIQFVNNGDSAVDVYCNGEYASTIDKNFGSTADKDKSAIDIYYNVKQNAFIGEGDAVVATPDKNLDGSDFNGFSSGKAYVSLQLNDLTGSSQLKLYTLASCMISDDSEDVAKPVIVSGPNFVVTQRSDVGTKVTLEQVTGFDLYDENVVVELKIEAPDASILYDDVMTDDYTFLNEQYGTYKVTYTALDRSGNFKSIICSVVSIDRIAPEITVPTPKKKANVGEEIKFEEIVASDNFTKECVTWISVTHGNSHKDMVAEGKYTFEEAGTYEVKYCAMDDAGNYSIVTHVIECK